MGKKKSLLTVNAEYYAFILCAAMVRILPLRVCYALSGLIARLLFIFDGKHRRRVLEHLLYAGVADGKKDAVDLAKKNSVHLGKLAVEILKMDQLIDPENIKKQIRLSGSKKAAELFFTSEKPSPAIIVSAHFGNWELGAIGYSLLSGHSLLSIIRPFDNPRIGQYICRQRERYNHKICPKEKGLKLLLSTLRKGESVAILADQHASTTEGVETIFFGHPARTHASPAMLHLKTGVPILVGITHRVNDNFTFEFVCKDPIIMEPTGNKQDDIHKLVQMYTTALEELIRECPEQWMWAHRRWLDIDRIR